MSVFLFCLSAGVFPENEMLLGVAADAYERATGQADFPDRLQEFPELPTGQDLMLNWSEADPESRRLLCPQVFDRLGQEPF